VWYILAIIEVLLAFLFIQTARANLRKQASTAFIYGITYILRSFSGRLLSRQIVPRELSLNGPHS
jgi:hypothetical protein